MSVFSRLLPTFTQSVRRYAIPHPYSHRHHYDSFAHGKKLQIMLAIATPIFIAAHIYVYRRERDHMTHYPDGMPELPEYYNILNKPFPWGDGKTPLFIHLTGPSPKFKTGVRIQKQLEAEHQARIDARAPQRAIRAQFEKK